MKAKCLMIVIMLIAGTNFVFAEEHTKDTLEMVKKSVADGKAILVDVREKDEWEDGHLKDAKLLPLSDLKKSPSSDMVKKLLTKDKIIYLHCASGIRCKKAADLLKPLGYDVRPLKDGYDALIKAKFEKAK